jgi:methyltransferase
MGVREWAYFAFLALVGCQRIAEVRISARNQKRMEQRGMKKVEEPNYPWVVALHTGLLIGAALEVWLLRRPLLPWLAISMGAIFLLSTALRVWTIRAMSGHWSMQIMDSTQLGVVTGGPYRWIQHPNYVAVVLEIFSIPLIHTAWITALVATAGYQWLLHGRLAVEESVLQSSPVYRSAMGTKPRFIPRFF